MKEALKWIGTSLSNEAIIYFSDYLLLINYAMILAKEGDFEKSKKIFKLFEEKYKKLGGDIKHREPEVAQNYETLLYIYTLV